MITHSPNRRVLAFTLLACCSSGLAQVRAPAPRTDEPPPPAESDDAERLADLLPGAGQFRINRVLNEIGQERDARFVAPLTDVLRFTAINDLPPAFPEVLTELTGQNLDPADNPWETLMIWIGSQERLQPPAGYAEWKGELLARMVDPGFRQFLHHDVPATIRLEEIAWGGVKVDGIQPLDHPRMTPAEQARYLRDEDPVLGVSINGDERAYPLRILDWHEMVNDVVGQVPVTLAYCTLCGAGILYDATIEGRPHDFGSSGLLYRSNKLMYDRQTKTLWDQLTGQPVVGQFVPAKKQLSALPLVSTSWGRWKQQHPNTKVLSIATGHRQRYMAESPYASYFASPDLRFPVWLQDRALPAKELVFALRIDNRAKAYPLRSIADHGGVINDGLGLQGIVIVGRPPSDPLPLPDAWNKAVSSQKPPVTDLEWVNQLSLAQILKALDSKRDLTRTIDADFLLALPVEVRLPLLAERTPDRKSGRQAPPGMLAPDLRNEVALRGFVAEARAYQRGSHTYTFSPSGKELVDERNRLWQITEETLISPEGERMPRVAGHLAYWFGWYAFYPNSEVYDQRSAGRPERAPGRELLQPRIKPR